MSAWLRRRLLKATSPAAVLFWSGLEFPIDAFFLIVALYVSEPLARHESVPVSRNEYTESLYAMYCRAKFFTFSASSLPNVDLSFQFMVVRIVQEGIRRYSASTVALRTWTDHNCQLLSSFSAGYCQLPSWGVVPLDKDASANYTA